MTIGLSRNNPGNLLPANVPWFGLEAAQPDQGPLAFDTMTDGIRAFVKLCYTYQNNGLNSPFKFIWNYSPISANNPTERYIANVCQWTGFTEAQVLDFHDTTTMISWAHAIFRQEQGEANGITDEQIMAGIAATTSE